MMRDLGLRRLGLLDLGAQQVAEVAAVGQLGDGVEIGVPPDLLLRAFLAGGVGEQRDIFGFACAAIDLADAGAGEKRFVALARKP